MVAFLWIEMLRISVGDRLVFSFVDWNFIRNCCLLLFCGKNSGNDHVFLPEMKSFLIFPVKNPKAIRVFCPK